MTTPCPHCWTPEAQYLAAENATIAALQVENARLARELAAMERTAHAIADERTHIAVERYDEWKRAESYKDAVDILTRENAAMRARIISQHALIASMQRIRTVLVAALRRQAARLRAMGG